MAVRRLGRGLDTLIPQRVVDESEKILKVPIEKIAPNPEQPRKSFDRDALQDLSQSIQSYGLIQPLVVMRNGDNYQIIAGERRYQASKMAGIPILPVIVRDVDVQRKLEIALVENVQRENLNPLEEAIAYRRLIDEFNLTLKELGRKIGKQVPTISNKVRLLDLPDTVKEGLTEGKITEGHARALLGLGSPRLIELAYGQILRDKLSVRQVEQLVKEKNFAENRPQTRRTTRRVRWQSQERHLQDRLGTKVSIKEAAGKGAISIAFYSEEELNRLIELLAKLEG